MTAYGIDVIGSARNGEEAIQMFKSFEKKPDFIIMDHRMPLKNGIATTEEILHLDENAKIIFASADKSVEGLALSKGAICFFTKPFHVRSLIDFLKKELVP